MAASMSPAKPPAMPSGLGSLLAFLWSAVLASTEYPPMPPVTSECSMVETTMLSTSSTSLRLTFWPSRLRPPPTAAAEPISILPI